LLSRIAAVATAYATDVCLQPPRRGAQNVPRMIVPCARVWPVMRVALWEATNHNPEATFVPKSFSSLKWNRGRRWDLLLVHRFIDAASADITCCLQALLGDDN